MGDRSIRALLLILVVLGLFLGAYEEIWEQGAVKVSSLGEGVDNKKEIYLEVIWDASGSMWGRSYGVEKILRSKEVLQTFSSQIPEDFNLGLRIFGARRVGDLHDSFLAVPFQKDSDEMVNFIANVQPLGKSPIGYSLEKARGDLAGVEGTRYVMLISDGLDNGNLPPEKVINELAGAGIILHVVYIGEPDDPELIDRLKSMAEKTGGRYFTYNEREQIIPTLRQSN